MTYEQFLDLDPCGPGILYVNYKGNDVRRAWDECKDTSNLLWFAYKSTKRLDLLVIFANECAGRALTYANACANAYADADAADNYAACAAYAAYAAYAADYANSAANSADVKAAEKEIQHERLKELFTSIIFNN